MSSSPDANRAALPDPTLTPFEQEIVGLRPQAHAYRGWAAGGRKSSARQSSVRDSQAAKSLRGSFDARTQEFGKLPSRGANLELSVTECLLAYSVRLFGQMSPYVVASFAGQINKSAIHEAAGRKPVWNWKCRFENIPEGDVGILEIVGLRR